MEYKQNTKACHGVGGTPEQPTKVKLHSTVNSLDTLELESAKFLQSLNQEDARQFKNGHLSTHASSMMNWCSVQTLAIERQDQKMEDMKTAMEKQASLAAQQTCMIKSLLSRMDDNIVKRKKTFGEIAKNKSLEDWEEDTGTVIDFSPKSHAENLSITQLCSFMVNSQELPRTLDRLKDEQWNTANLCLPTFLSVKIWTKGYFDSIQRYMKVVSSRGPTAAGKNTSHFSVKCRHCLGFKLEWQQGLDTSFFVRLHTQHSKKCDPIYFGDQGLKFKSPTNYSTSDLAPLIVPVMSKCLTNQSKMSIGIVRGLLQPFVMNAESLDKSFLSRIKQNATELISGSIETQGEKQYVNLLSFYVSIYVNYLFASFQKVQNWNRLFLQHGIKGIQLYPFIKIRTIKEILS